ncbi:MAG: RtcB family protein [Anaerolineaceae bacterium]|nr:RtcB family protein [Anaerolineaceae bacterium]
MRLPVHIFASRKMLEQVLVDRSLEQAVNASTLPGLVGNVIVMPDVHQGYGFPIGGVAASQYPTGMISPGAIGYDINCGVRLLASTIKAELVSAYLGDLAAAMNHFCPSGVGSEGLVRISNSDLEQVLHLGSRWALKKGYASEADLLRTEESGCVEGALPDKVSGHAKKRGLTQLGSLGSGNHFIEIDTVDEIFNPEAAAVMGLQCGCLVIQIHCGSRGLGHQICTDYVQQLQGAPQRYHYSLPDRELVCAPMDSTEGQAYLGAMRAAANFAFANRQMLAWAARRAFEEVFAGKVKNWQLHQVYDLAHNIGKIETHIIEGKELKVCVHRKGATRAFGPNTPGVPPEYAMIGQPVIIPGSMGTASWVLTGTNVSMQRSFGSCCHGAGRLMSRAQAKRSVRGEVLIRDLEKQGIHVKAGSLPGLAEETPAAYKDVDEVIKVVVDTGLANKTARLKPLVVIKG